MAFSRFSVPVGTLNEYELLSGYDYIQRFKESWQKARWETMLAITQKPNLEQLLGFAFSCTILIPAYLSQSSRQLYLLPSFVINKGLHDRMTQDLSPISTHSGIMNSDYHDGMAQGMKPISTHSGIMNYQIVMMRWHKTCHQSAHTQELWTNRLLW